MELPDNKMAKRWVTVKSSLLSLDGTQKDIKIEIMEDGMPKAMAFFDIDGTLAHLSAIHGQAIKELFTDADPEELEQTYYAGFKLGNSFREFDRMKGIYADGRAGWKDPKTYWRERYLPHAKEIDEPGNLAHNIAVGILKAYGEIATKVADEIYQKDPGHFKQSNIAPIFLLARLYSRLGIPIVGFTANAKVLVERLAKYLGLSEMFLDIATDEMMAGGGKELAVASLFKEIEAKGILVPKDRLIFVGDSLRGDIGILTKVRELDSKVNGTGVLVLKDKDSLIEIKKEISGDPSLRALADQMEIEGLMVDSVPLDPKGEPRLWSRFRGEFMERL